MDAVAAAHEAARVAWRSLRDATRDDPRVHRLVLEMLDAIEDVLRASTARKIRERITLREKRAAEDAEEDAASAAAHHKRRALRIARAVEDEALTEKERVVLEKRRKT
jgi:hypothetical protein